jgi:hypothetical protein
MKKSLIEGFKNYWKEYSKFRKTYRLKIEYKLGDILSILGHNYNYIENFELINHEKQIIVSYVFEDMNLYPPDLSHRYVHIPIEWLDMSKKEIVKAQEEHEKRERKNYERLKKKFEG